MFYDYFVLQKRQFEKDHQISSGSNPLSQRNKVTEKLYCIKRPPIIFFPDYKLNLSLSG